jgi:hypothetical protein
MYVDAGLQHRAISGQFNTPPYQCNGGGARYLTRCGHRLESEELGFNSLEGQNFFSFLQGVQTGSGAHSASYTMGTGGSYSEVKWPGGEANR